MLRGFTMYDTILIQLWFVTHGSLKTRDDQEHQVSTWTNVDVSTVWSTEAYYKVTLIV